MRYERDGEVMYVDVSGKSDHDLMQLEGRGWQPTEDGIDIEDLPLEEDMDRAYARRAQVTDRMRCVDQMARAEGDEQRQDKEAQRPKSANDISDEDLKKLGDQIAATEDKRLAEELYRRFYLSPLEAFEDWLARNMATRAETRDTWRRYLALRNKLTEDELEFVKTMMSWSYRLAEERNRS